MVYPSWDMESDRRILSHFWPFFALLPLPPNNPENQNFENRKRTSGDIIILQKCTINSNDVYGSWDIMWDRQNFLSFWAIFFHFIPLTVQKMKNSNKWKEHLEIFSFYMYFAVLFLRYIFLSCCYTVPEIWHGTDDRCNCYFSFWANFCPFTLLTAYFQKRKNFY